MLKIKLARYGKRKQPHYRIVINEARDKRDGSYVAKIGHYAPTHTPKILELDLDAYQNWIKKGAQPTQTVAQLAERFKSGNPFPAKKKKLSKKAKQKLATKKEEKEETKTKDSNPEDKQKTAATAGQTESQEKGKENDKKTDKKDAESQDK